MKRDYEYYVAMIGIDEVGRGAWAGPLLVVATRLRSGKSLPQGLRDSKKLSKIRRQQLLREIVESCDIGQGWISAREVDKYGLTISMQQACKISIQKLDAKSDEVILLDGNRNYLKDSGFTVMTIIGGDDSEPIISAASIVAKVLRDEYMAKLDDKYIGYEFVDHVGYGTKKHMTALKNLGICPEHRVSVKPVAEIIGDKTIQAIKSAAKNSSGSVGEKLAAGYLISKSYEIIDQNWKTIICEIDIIVMKNNVISFVEVKTRMSDQFGDSLEMIGPKKLHDMKKAAEIWCLKNNYTGQVMLSAIGVNLATDQIVFIEQV